MLTLQHAPDNVPQATAILHELAHAMVKDDFILTAEEAATIFRAYIRARAAGYQFDPFTRALMTIIRRQLSRTDEDGDSEPEYLEDADDDLMSAESGTDDLPDARPPMIFMAAEFAGPSRWQPLAKVGQNLVGKRNRR